MLFAGPHHIQNAKVTPEEQLMLFGKSLSCKRGGGKELGRNMGMPVMSQLHIYCYFLQQFCLAQVNIHECDYEYVPISAHTIH